ncbi:MAG: ABC transporter substrate-binding protein, partial [Clostridia bacterium]|nr:ABC transporter substrate-binding protein [Clostridia bacterium]
YKKTGGAVKVAGVNTLGVLYVLENGDTVNSVGDLKGKTIFVTGQGSTPEYVLNYILTKNGIDPEKDITIEFLAEHAELAAQMTSGSVSLGLLPQPNVTSVLMNNSDVRIALDFTEEWRKVSDSDLVMGCIIVSKEFAEEHSDELETFLEEYGKSVEFVNSDADGASKLIEEAGIVPKAAIAKNALPYCNIVLDTGETMRSQMNGMLGVLYEANPASVGGSLPDEAFFYMVK